jgi:hypothetical protein
VKTGFPIAAEILFEREVLPGCHHPQDPNGLRLHYDEALALHLATFAVKVSGEISSIINVTKLRINKNMPLSSLQWPLLLPAFGQKMTHLLLAETDKRLP